MTTTEKSNNLLEAIDAMIAKEPRDTHLYTHTILLKVRKLIIADRERIIKELRRYLLSLPDYGIVGDEEVAECVEIVIGKEGDSDKQE